jgi:hypothetical protein
MPAEYASSVEASSIIARAEYPAYPGIVQIA